MSGTLTVQLLRIGGLEGEDGLFGKNDIYVKLELGDETFKTKTYKKAGKRLEFDDEVFRFNVSRREYRRGKIELKAYDDDRFKDDKLGEGKIDVGDAVDNGTNKVKFGLFGHDGWIEFACSFAEA